MLRQIVSPLGALFTLEFPDDIHAYLSDKDEKELADRLAYMQRIAGGADASSNPGQSDRITRIQNITKDLLVD